MKKQNKKTVELKEKYIKNRIAIRKRLREYSLVPQTQYFYEMVYCLMTPQSSAVNAGKAQQVFELMDYQNQKINIESVLRNKRHYIRFHKTKARWIAEMKENFSTIFQMIISPFSAKIKREWLVQHVKGLSYKEASHFLRNIGCNDGLTIIDRHILKNLHYYGVIRSVPQTLTKKKYFIVEEKFQAFAKKIGISVDELDLLFWSNETGKILK